jgi:hypothetical protein
MKIKARVLSKDDKEIAPGALKGTARDIPVTVGFDGARVVGRATVFPDGTAELDIDVPVEFKSDGIDSDVLGLGFVVEQQRQEGNVRVIERLRPVTVGVSAALLDRLKK